MPTGADVPSIYDVVIDSQGYIFDDASPSRAEFMYSPAFVERSNVTNAYGDDQQEFFMTAAQANWTGGEEQRFFRISDEESRSAYWAGSNIDVSVPGQVTLKPALTTVTAGATVYGNNWGGNGQGIYAGGATNLYEMVNGAAIDRGAHGAGGQVRELTFDGVYVYLSGPSCTKIRRYDTSAHTFADFDPLTAATKMCFVNNTLFGFRTTGFFGYYDTAGAFTTAYQWKNATGLTLGNGSDMTPYGGKVAVLRGINQCTDGAEVWLADTTGAQIIAVLPKTFTDSTMVNVNGVLFIIGNEANSSLGYKTSIYYIANGTLGRLYTSVNSFNGSFAAAGISAYQNGLLFSDIASQSLRYYDLTTGGVSSVADFASSIGDVYMTVGYSGFVVLTYSSATTSQVSTVAPAASSGYVSSSLIDLESTLTKTFRAVSVDFTPATDGNGGSVDIYYQLGSLDGAYTLLQTGAVAGTEYLLNQNARSISVRVVLNKGTSTLGPRLKRVYVRAAPISTSFRKRTYYLKLKGRSSTNRLVRRDGTAHNKDAVTMAGDLQTSVSQTAPISIIDHLGTFTGVIEGDGLKVVERGPDEWYAVVNVREV